MLERRLATGHVASCRIGPARLAHGPGLHVQPRIRNRLHAGKLSLTVRDLPVAVEHLDNRLRRHLAENTPVRRILGVSVQHATLESVESPTSVVLACPLDLVEKAAAVVLKRPGSVHEQTLRGLLVRTQCAGDTLVQNLCGLLPESATVRSASDLTEQNGDVLDGFRSDLIVDGTPTDPCCGTVPTASQNSSADSTMVASLTGARHMEIPYQGGVGTVNHFVKSDSGVTHEPCKVVVRIRLSAFHHHLVTVLDESLLLRL